MARKYSCRNWMCGYKLSRNRTCRNCVNPNKSGKYCWRHKKKKKTTIQKIPIPPQAGDVSEAVKREIVAYHKLRVSLQVGYEGLRDLFTKWRKNPKCKQCLADTIGHVKMVEDAPYDKVRANQLAFKKLVVAAEEKIKKFLTMTLCKTKPREPNCMDDEIADEFAYEIVMKFMFKEMMHDLANAKGDHYKYCTISKHRINMNLFSPVRGERRNAFILESPGLIPHLVRRCKARGYSRMLIPVTISGFKQRPWSFESRHSNYLLIDFNKKEARRVEPNFQFGHGIRGPSGSDYSLAMRRFFTAAGYTYKGLFHKESCPIGHPGLCRYVVHAQVIYGRDVTHADVKRVILSTMHTTLSFFCKHLYIKRGALPVENYQKVGMTLAEYTAYLRKMDDIDSNSRRAAIENFRYLPTIRRSFKKAVMVPDKFMRYVG